MSKEIFETTERKLLNSTEHIKEADFKDENKQQNKTIGEFDEFQDLDCAIQVLRAYYDKYNVKNLSLTKDVCNKNKNSHHVKNHKRKDACANTSENNDKTLTNDNCNHHIIFINSIIDETERFLKELLTLFYMPENLDLQTTCQNLFDLKSNYNLLIAKSELIKYLEKKKRALNRDFSSSDKYICKILKSLKRYIQSFSKWNEINAENLKMVVVSYNFTEIGIPKYDSDEYELMLRTKLIEHLDQILMMIDYIFIQESNECARKIRKVIKETTTSLINNNLDYTKTIEYCLLNKSIENERNDLVIGERSTKIDSNEKFCTPMVLENNYPNLIDSYNEISAFSVKENAGSTVTLNNYLFGGTIGCIIMFIILLLCTKKLKKSKKYHVDNETINL